MHTHVLQVYTYSFVSSCVVAPIITSPDGNDFEIEVGGTLSVSLDIMANPPVTDFTWRTLELKDSL